MKDLPLLTPERARSDGYIPIDEAITIKPVNRSTLARQAQKREIPAVYVAKGSRQVYWILKTALTREPGRTSYCDMEAAWLEAMHNGSFTGKPMSDTYIDRILRYGMRRFWTLLGEPPSLEALNGSNFDKVVTHPSLATDDAKRNDHFSTKNNIFRACTRFVDWLVTQGHKSHADRLDFKKPKRKYKAQKRMLEEEQIREVIQFNKAWCDGRAQVDVETTNLLLHLYAYAGIRRMEAASLRIDEINFNQDVMLIFGKGGKERYVPLNLFPQLRPVLEDWILRWRPKYKSELLIIQANGKPLTETSINQRFQRLSAAINLKKAHRKLALDPAWPKLDKVTQRARVQELADTMTNLARPHDLRRACATILALRGMPMPMIQFILGHEDLKTTQGYVLTNLQHVMSWTAANQGTPTPAKQAPDYFSRDQLFA